MIPKREQRDWRELARRAANEQDPKKLLEIIEELNAVLEEREKEIRGRIAKPAVPTVSTAYQVGSPCRAVAACAA